MPTLDTLLTRGPRIVLRQAEELGLERSELLGASGLREADLAEPDSRTPMSQWNALWRFILESTGDAGVGLRMGSTLQVREIGLLGYTMQHSGSLGGALERYSRFFALWRAKDPPHYDVDAHQVEVGWRAQPVMPLFERPICDWALAGVLALLRELSGEDVTPKEIHLPYAKGDHDLAEAREYFAAPLRFERPRAQLVLHTKDLELETRPADLELGRYLDQHAAQVIEGLSLGAGVVEQTERALWQGMKTGEVSLEDVASRMAMSARTLQRRLRSENASFTDLRDKLRHELATDLLADSELSIYEVVYLLGYSEPSAFYRAFRRWEGASPQKFRAAS
jgi:AraC-like DNA-binding protein